MRPTFGSIASLFFVFFLFFQFRLLSAVLFPVV
jgi:hypothetical protein